MSKSAAINEIKQRICGCYGSVDLKFALHPSDEKTAKSLKALSKKYSISKSEVEDAITPVIEDWLASKYYGFGENEPRAYHDDKNVRASKASDMISEAVRYIVS
ncbi:hypothetical protein [Acetobacter cerevisiae]|uniref:hypothetical protein n=1 Tax=Acetobacter cerevisiae TaxID=178900 RepID=UPI000A9D0FF7|nr:hypothetical protein [Acetobacter cerevisiae]